MKIDFSKFVESVQKLELGKETFSASAHHSNGSGRDWEALQRQLKSSESSQ
ncbi:hypothetical protein [Paenibacillus paeoniae]|uniref:hypothetical protein n=1 Tax=Paenibacillus paeoniae TaxID=2292705 RepID=UPI0014032829|nr:hypothetical protein [Paenibacillus paeoniae]